MEARENKKSEEAIKPVCCVTPNQHARPASLEIGNQEVTFHGYQEFVLTRLNLIVLTRDQALLRKQEILAPFFTPEYFKRRQVLDLGANSGFFSFWALQSKAEQVVALEIDEDYLRMMREASAKLGFQGLEVTRANFDDWSRPADVVLCLALVHWIFSCTAICGSLDSIVEKLADLTGYLLIVEWIDPNDEAIRFFNHLDWNKDFIREPYSMEAFEAALGRCFSKYEVIGEVGPTRRIYAAFKTDLKIDLDGSLPFIFDKESLISSRLLTRINGIDYWSRLYDCGDVIQKQATLDLATREHFFLSELSSDYFPRAFETRSENEYSVISLEKIRGIAFADAKESLRENRSKLYEFIQHCLNILDELKKKEITHRDILPDNLIQRDGKPVLIDFGWAISPTRPSITPDGLGLAGRPPDGTFCDVFSMGKVFDLVNGHRYSEFDWVIERMTDPENSLRIVDVPILRLLFSCVVDDQTRMGKLDMNSTEPSEPEEEHRASLEYEQAVRQLLDQVSQLNRLLTISQQESERLKEQVAENESALQTLTEMLQTLTQIMTHTRKAQSLRAHNEATTWLQEELQKLAQSDPPGAATGLRSVIARIPLIRRPMYQVDQALQERDRALIERDRALIERDAAIRERDALRSALHEIP